MSSVDYHHDSGSTYTATLIIIAVVMSRVPVVMVVAKHEGGILICAEPEPRPLRG
jgi:hypothetical protein